MKNQKVNNALTPIYRDAGFNLTDPETTKAAFAQELDHPHTPDNYIYSRYRNPTVVAVENQIMQIEECNWALLCESGMAAIDIAVSMYQKGKDTRPWLFFSEIYGGTNSYIDTVLIKRRGLDIKRFNETDGKYDLVKLETMLKEIRPEFMYFEAVSNPMLIVADVKAIISLAKKYETKIIIDNTFATPALWKPLQDGADLVIHSATKYLSGHGNITAGVVCGNDIEIMKQAIEYRKWAGHFLSPDDAYRLGTQLKTFEMRFKQHCNNAIALAELLQSHNSIEEVLYPGIVSHPTYNEAKNLFGNSGFGGMITFDFKGGSFNEKLKTRDRFIELVKDTIPLIPTMGEAETILLPVESVWGAKYPLPGMIRLSTGIENTEWLKQTFLNALNSL